jgi:hypothetical protein
MIVADLPVVLTEGLVVWQDGFYHKLKPADFDNCRTMRSLIPKIVGHTSRDGEVIQPESKENILDALHTIFDFEDFDYDRLYDILSDSCFGSPKKRAMWANFATTYASVFDKLQ